MNRFRGRPLNRLLSGKIFKHFARFAWPRRLDLPRGLSAHGDRKEVSMMQANSRDRARKPRTQFSENVCVY
jgi:hypothetical protein